MNEVRKRIEEDFSPTFPDDDIKCKDCVFRKPDLVIEGKTIVKGYKNGYCKVYTEDIRGKPNEVLFKNANCKHYRKDDS